ncbi:hypothetical protein CP880_10575 [Cutibacterium namnetense]|uniref:Uncharacterized protein n=1 Tax=Cutibacterium namnetense TaxID=1574624 RepID=A0ABX9IAX5_9ACTN|nr:hypothetical protein CP880_10575 [Cutibacterium namnetense]
MGDEAGFALAGTGAIREHGLIDRPTEDVARSLSNRPRPAAQQPSADSAKPPVRTQRHAEPLTTSCPNHHG